MTVFLSSSIFFSWDSYPHIWWHCLSSFTCWLIALKLPASTPTCLGAMKRVFHAHVLGHHHNPWEASQTTHCTWTTICSLVSSASKNTLSSLTLPALWSSAVQFSHSLVPDSLWPHGLQHFRPPCPSPTPGVYSNSCPLSRWCHLAISSSVIPFSSHLQSFPASRFFQMSQFFTSGCQSIEVSASVLPMNIQDWSPLGWTAWISLLSKGFSRVCFNNTVQKHQFFGT